MNLYCIRFSKFKNNKNNIKMKPTIDGKIYLYSHCIDDGFYSRNSLMEILKVYPEEQLLISSKLFDKKSNGTSNRTRTGMGFENRDLVDR